MDVLTIAQAVLRRWYVVLPVVLAFGGAAYYLDSTIPPQYEARGEVLLADPELDPSDLPRSSVSLTDAVDGLLEAEVREDQTVGSTTLDATASRNGVTLEIEGDSFDDVEASAARAREWLQEMIEGQQESDGIDPLEWLRLEVAAEDITSSEEGDEILQTVSLALEDPGAAATNPYGASNETGRILIVAMSSDAGRAQVAERTGPSVSFEVTQDAQDAAPILTITTTGAEPTQVLEAYEHVSAALGAELAAREARAEVPTSRQTSVERIAAPQQVQDVSPPLDRSVGAIVGLGGLISLVLAVVIDSWLTTRRRRAEADRLSDSAVPWERAEERPITQPYADSRGERVGTGGRPASDESELK